MIALVLTSLAFAGSARIVAGATDSADPTLSTWAHVRAQAPRVGSLGGPASLPGATAVGVCGDLPAKVGDVEAALTRAQAARDYLDTDGMQTHLKVALRAAECLDAAPPAGMLARVHMMAGIAAALSKDPEGAERSYRQALTQDPRLTWDDAITPDARPPFDRALDAMAAAGGGSVRVVPAPAGGVWIDGVALATDGAQQLRAGTHLVQVQCSTVQSMTVTVAQGSVTDLLVPCALPVELSAAMADPAARAVTGEVLGGLYPADELVVTLGETVWRRSAGSTGWTRGGTWRRRVLPLGVTLASAVGTGALYAVASGAHDDFAGAAVVPADASEADRAAAQTRFEDLQSTANGFSYGYLGAGALAVAGSVWMVMAW